MELTNLDFKLRGKKINPPLDWEGLQLPAVFSEDSVQADISTESFKFSGLGRKIIKDHIKEGYYFEGIPFVIQLKNGENNYNAFNGFLDLQDTYVNIVGEDKVSSKIKKLDGLNTIGEKLSGTTFGFIDSLGFVNSVDVQYVVEKKNNFLEIVMTGITIYLMVKELIEIQKKLSENITDAVAMLTGGGTTGGLGAALLLAGKIVVNAAFSVLISEALLELSEQMLANFISPVKKYKMASYFELMRAASEFLGYGFSSTIVDLQNTYNLPSKPYEEEITSGIPRTSDLGYNCGEFFNMMKKRYSGVVGVKDGVIHFENKDSNFWVKQSTWKLPSVFAEATRKNGDELMGTRLVSYETDPNDEHTIQNIKGTYYEIRTLQKNYKTGFDYLTIDQVDDRTLGVCLPNRKDRLNELEEALKALAELVDEVISTVGGTSNLASLVQNRVGMLKLGTAEHTIPRSVYMINGKIPPNHRDKISAKALYEQYIKADSFVLSKNGGQKQVFENVRVLFGFNDFTQLIDNSYFTTTNGSVGKITKINWTIDGDYANLDYWIQDPEATDKLIESYIEPS